MERTGGVTVESGIQWGRTVCYQKTDEKKTQTQQKKNAKAVFSYSCPPRNSKRGLKGECGSTLIIGGKGLTQILNRNCQVEQLTYLLS